MKGHLSEAHNNELHKLKGCDLQSNGLFVCWQCGDYVAQAEGVFLHHLRSKHITTRATTNMDIATKHLFPLVAPVHNNYKEKGLEWLHTFTPGEPSFCQSLISKIKYELEDDVTNCFKDLLKTCVESAQKPSNDSLSGSDEYDPEPL